MATRTILTVCMISMLVGNHYAFVFRSRASFGRYTTSQQLASAPSSSIDHDEPPIILNGHNIELTDALEDHVKRRLSIPLSKLASHDAIKECDVILSVNKNPKVRSFSLRWSFTASIDPWISMRRLVSCDSMDQSITFLTLACAHLSLLILLRIHNQPYHI